MAKTQDTPDRQDGGAMVNKLVIPGTMLLIGSLIGFPVGGMSSLSMEDVRQVMEDVVQPIEERSRRNERDIRDLLRSGATIQTGSQTQTVSFGANPIDAVSHKPRLKPSELAKIEGVTTETIIARAKSGRYAYFPPLVNGGTGAVLNPYYRPETAGKPTGNQGVGG